MSIKQLKIAKKTAIILFLTVFLSGCAGQGSTPAGSFIYISDNSTADEKTCKQKTILVEQKKEAAIDQLKESLRIKYRDRKPKLWGENVPGVMTKLDTSEKIIALTFDACGGSKLSNGVDTELIDFLIQEGIPATLFLSGRWIEANPEYCRFLADNSNFEIENHGFRHKPLSVNGKSVYNVQGTTGIEEIIDEVETNARQIEKYTGRKPKYFRSGTAYYDEIAVQIVGDLGYQVVNFNVIGDGGATYSKQQVKHATLKAQPGSIIIYHMNHPEGSTSEGLIEGVKELKEKGYRFVKLEEYRLK
ncbi:polysaccharide deacetylase family protein [Thermanaerosceptrum fracticalcis]|uniref:Polysaccharide deacetylase family protein n=1 Tax=Thermanaerosceptrum fracticalcis TaxID=1712410 RepID=A0A7G6E0K4_THEFR|nr:polysaccharide deacetylase family protein [Thermanaerosceptrum fracticalcis]QNB45608.1 polysaccharide deacetylase family protein [Thermanaerosceptrum fracticalcis]